MNGCEMVLVPWRSRKRPDCYQMHSIHNVRTAQCLHDKNYSVPKRKTGPGNDQLQMNDERQSPLGSTLHPLSQNKMKMQSKQRNKVLSSPLGDPPLLRLLPGLLIGGSRHTRGEGVLLTAEVAVGAAHGCLGNTGTP
jgi:hypothetical protein